MMTESSYDEGNSPWSPWKPEIFGDIFSRRVFRPLPPLNEALSLLKDYFDNFNCMFPLFHEPTFMHLVNRQYSRDPYDGSGWWASLNCALAIAHRLRVMSNLVPQEEDQKAWGFMKNALGVLTELTMRNTDLLSVQALLGMVFFVHPVSILIFAHFSLGSLPPWYAKPATIISIGSCCNSPRPCYRPPQERDNFQLESRRDRATKKGVLDRLLTG